MIRSLESLMAKGQRSSPFDRLIALEVYDGPIRGLAICRRSAEVAWFRLLAWNDTQQLRIFELAPLSASDEKAVASASEEAAQSRWPEWWLGRRGAHDDNPDEDHLARIIEKPRGGEYVVVTKNLLGELRSIVRVYAPEHRPEFQRLSRREHESAEVSDGTFEEWLQLIDNLSNDRR